MANRYDRNPYQKSRYNSSYSRSGMPHRRNRIYRRRFRFNAFNVSLIALIVIAGTAVGISLAVSKGHAASDGAAGSGTTMSHTDSPVGTADGGADQTAESNVSTASAVASAPAQPTDPPGTDDQSGLFTAGDVQVDEAAMTYKSADLNVKITNVNENGQNYYVADCRMKDSNRLFTALATDEYVVHKEEKTSVMAQRKGAVIAINGDYFGASAQDRGDRGIVIRNGQLYRKTPWYDIAAIYNDGTMKTFDKSGITADQLVADGAVQAFSFGPMLLDGDGKAIVTSELKLRPPKYNPANPRCGIGYVEPNHFMLVVVDGRGAGGGKGMTTSEFAQLFESLGCKSAYNFDGGGSATMVFMGNVINHPCDDGGERSVSDIVYFGESETDQANIDRINSQ